MGFLKKWLKGKLRNVLAIPQIEKTVDQLRRDNSYGLYGDAFWYEQNYWEPCVQIALRDLCKPSNVAFDIGANFGGLTTVMSRSVGPRGIVCAFEASPRIVDKCQRNVILNGCNNVQVYNLAVYHSSYQKIPLYLGDHLNDSIFSQGKKAAYHVQTIALDDFIRHTKLIPDVIKMDIEGAEFDALQGMLNTLKSVKPCMILETKTNERKCLDLLLENDYIAIDLHSYRQIKTTDDYPTGAIIRNNLYVHKDKLTNVPYRPPFNFVNTCTLTNNDFFQDNKYIEQKNYITLEKGRYLIDVDFFANGTDNQMMCGVKLGNEVIFRYHAYTKILSESYRDWVINLTGKGNIKLYFEFLNNTYDLSFSVKGAKIFRIREFDNLSPELFT